MKTGTREWAEHNENCIRGCSNNCRYCYAKDKAIQYKRETADTWPVEHPNLNAKASRHKKGRSMFPTAHDLHYNHVDWWAPHLYQLLTKGNDVLIVTKPEYAAIAHICKDFADFKDQIEFRFTIGTNDDTVAAYWEPGAPSPSDRLMAIAHACTLGFRTSISMEPLLIEQPKEMIDTLFMGWIIGEIWIGAMNHYHLDPAIPEEARQIRIQSRENLQRVYESLKDNPQIRWKDSVQRLLGITATGEPIKAEASS
jgi:hypothetical protein